LYPGCNSSSSTDTLTNVSDNIKQGIADSAVIEFEEVNHDFGKVSEGEIVGWYFNFKNTGKTDLVIKKADASCGCTVSEFIKEPVKPGGEGYIKVWFNSSGRRGLQYKSVYIKTNSAGGTVKLSLSADVVN